MKEVRSLVPEESEVYTRYFKEHYEMIYGIALSKVGDPNVADVVAQETFVTAWERFDKFQSSENPVGWLVIVARNKSKEALRDRKEYLERRIYIRNVEDIPTEMDLDQIEPIVPETEEKRLLARFYEEGYTLKELAEQEDVKLSAMKMRIKRAKEKLKTIILEKM